MKNLNEEINRMKSLFTEERLYGNIESPKILNEQLKKVLYNILSGAGASLKNFDPKILTNFLEGELKSYDDIVKHLDDFDVIWKSIIKNDAIFIQAKKLFKLMRDIDAGKSSKYKNVGELPEEMFMNYLTGVTRKGGLRDQFLDLWLTSKGKTPKYAPDSSQKVVVKNADGDLVLHIKAEGSNSVDTYDVLTGKKVDYDNGKALDDFAGADVSKSGSGSKTKTETGKIDANGNPDVIKGDIIKAIEEGFEGIKGKTPTKMSGDEIIKQIDGGKILIIQDPKTGGFKVINNIEMIEFKVDADGIITDVKNIETKDVTPKGNPVNGGGGGSGKPKTEFSKKISNIIGGAGQTLRYIFPTYSQIGKIINATLGGGKLSWWNKPRISMYSGIKSKPIRVGLQIKENLIRVAMVEQMALMTINEIKESTQRGELPNSLISQTWSDYFYGENSIIKYNPLQLLLKGSKAIWNDLRDLESNALAVCKTKCENESNGDETKYGECYSKCEKSTKEFFGKLESFKKDLKEYKKNLELLNKVEDWNDNEIKNYCDNVDGKKTEIIENLKALKSNMKDIEEDIDDKFESGGLDSVITVLNYLPFIDISTIKDMKNDLFNTDVEGEPLTSTKIDQIEKKLSNACIEYWDKKEGNEDSGGGGYNDPDDNYSEPQPQDSNDENGESKKEKADRLFGQLSIELEPIEIA